MTEPRLPDDAEVFEEFRVRYTVRDKHVRAIGSVWRTRKMAEECKAAYEDERVVTGAVIERRVVAIGDWEVVE